MADIEETELSDKQKNEIAKWFLLNSPVGEIQYVAKGLFSLSLWFFDFLIFDFWFLEFGFALAFFFYDFSDLHFVLCAVLISWLFVHFGIFFLFCLVFLVDVKAILNDDALYNEAASEAFPLYNKSHMICLGMPGRAGDVSLWIYNELLKSLLYFVCVCCLILILGFRFGHLHW